MRWHKPAGVRELPTGRYAKVRGRIAKGVRRALSDEFTIVGDVAGRPVLMICLFDEARAALYLTMNADTLILQHDDGTVLEEGDIDRGTLDRWLGVLD